MGDVMIYTFKCEKCDIVEDRLVKMADADNQYCKECNEKMVQQDTFATAIAFKGRWYKTTKSY